MELAGQLLADVVRERAQIDEASSSSTKVDSALAEAERVLAAGLPVSVHVQMGHTECKAAEKELCKAAQKLEVWTFRVLWKAPCGVTARPPMLPLFLRQAIRSQLHFSPLRSWIVARKEKPESMGLCPLFNVSICSRFNDAANYHPAEQLSSHQFPPCRFDPSLPLTPNAKAIDTFWLQVQVQWLKREYFLSKSPPCPEMSRIEGENDAWVLPEAVGIVDGTAEGKGRCCEIETRDEEEAGRECSSSSTEEDFDCCSESSSSAPCTPPESPLPLQKRRGAKQQQNNSLGRRNSKGTTAELLARDKVLQVPTKETTALLRDNKHCEQKPIAAQHFVLPPTQHHTPRFHPRTRLPLSSSPVPPGGLFRRQHRLEQAKRDINVHATTSIRVNDDTRVAKEHQKTQAVAETIDDRGTPVYSPSSSRSSSVSTKWKCSTPSRLVCNFEESILSGRIMPSSTVDGFRLQLTVISGATGHHGTNNASPTSYRVTLPVQTYFFGALAEAVTAATPKAPSTLHMARCELGADAIPIPRRCTLQAVLFNPHGSVVKLFMVEVDVRDMPSNSRTFIRQRTFSGGTSEASVRPGQAEKGAISRGDTDRMENRIPDSNGETMGILPMLRFLIHLRLASDGTGQVHLHSDIRMLFSNKANDLEGLESILGRARGAVSDSTHIVVQMPNMPKYSPVK